MADSIRQLLWNEIKVRFQSIRTANGYETEVGQKCFAWRDLESSPFSADELKEIGPHFMLSDPHCVFEQNVANSQDSKLTIEVYAACFGTPPDDMARKILADIYRCLGQDRQWKQGGSGPKLAIDTRPGEDFIDLTHQNIRLAGVRVNFTVWFRTRSFDPYTQ